MVATPYRPEWKRYEKDVHSPNAHTQRKAADAFIGERELQLKTSAKSRRWEDDRKKEIAKNKPLWVKKRNKNDESTRNKSWNKLLQGGVFTNNLHPAPGYALIGIEPKEEVSDAGIVLAKADESPNEGLVIEVGPSLHLEKNTVDPPCKPGDNILFKRGAGLELNLKGNACRLIYFFDILGTFDES